MVVRSGAVADLRQAGQDVASGHERQHRDYRGEEEERTGDGLGHGTPPSVPSRLNDSHWVETMRISKDENEHLYLGISWRAEPTGAVGFGPEYPPEACLACADRASVRGSSRDDGDRAPSGQEQADGMALAGTLPQRKGSTGCCGIGTGGSGRAPLGARVKSLVLTKTMRETPPNATHWSVRTSGQGGRNQPYLRAEDLGRAWLEAASGFHLQGVERPEVRREGGGRYRTLPEPAGQGAGAFGWTRRARPRRSTAPSRACR